MTPERELEIEEDGGRRFFSDYCIITPRGQRLYPDTYFDYCQQLIKRIPAKVRQSLRAAYINAADYEIALEKEFQFPDEYLMGICEVYHHSTKSLCLAVANAESIRLKQAKDKASPPEAIKVAPHLDLILITSLNKSGLPDIDIGRRVVHRRRPNCLCMFCIPAVRPFQRDRLSEQDRVSLSSYLQLDATACNVYIPFRHRRYRELQDGQDPPAVTMANALVATLSENESLTMVNTLVTM